MLGSFHSLYGTAIKRAAPCKGVRYIVSGMKKFIVLILVLSTMALGIFFYPSLSSTLDILSGVSTSERKCTTQAGEIYYGDVPDGVVCQKNESVDTSLTVVKSPSQNVTESSMNYGNMKCDGRKYCSQMKSCKEAKFFLQKCPNTSMDGNNDGIPCQRQWCNF